MPFERENGNSCDCKTVTDLISSVQSSRDESTGGGFPCSVSVILIAARSGRSGAFCLVWAAERQPQRPGGGKKKKYKKTLDKPCKIGYNHFAVSAAGHIWRHSSVGRAFGSYPECHWFESNCRYQNGPLVKWLRHRPFTAVTWVRVPYGSPSSLSYGREYFGGVAQLVRAHASHA